jgi:hypothetical protein
VEQTCCLAVRLSAVRSLLRGELKALYVPLDFERLSSRFYQERGDGVKDKVVKEIVKRDYVS